MVVLTPTVRGDGDSGTTGGGYLHLPPPEHSRALYCNQAHYGPVFGGRAMPGYKGLQAVVGAGGPILGGDADGGLEGGKIGEGG